MAARKGQPKVAGRKKGTPNIATKDIKEAFKLLVEENIDNMSDWLGRIAVKQPDKALLIMLEMSKRFVPTLSSGTLDVTTDIPKTYKVNRTVVSKQK